MSRQTPGPRSPARGFDADRVNAVVQTLAILGAGAWGVYTFVYEARIKPGLAPPAVSVTTSLAKVGERDAQVAIRSTVTRRNVGGAGVRILGLAYTVTGIRARFGEDAARSDAVAEGLGARERIAVARDYALGEPGTVLLRQGVLFAGATERGGEPSDLNPGEAVSRDLIVYADRTRYDFVRFAVTLAYARDDDPSVQLVFALAGDGALTLAPRADCRTDPDPCRRLKTTDFDTELSLW